MRSFLTLESERAIVIPVRPEGTTFNELEYGRYGICRWDRMGVKITSPMTSDTSEMGGSTVSFLYRGDVLSSTECIEDRAFLIDISNRLNKYLAAKTSHTGRTLLMLATFWLSGLTILNRFYVWLFFPERVSYVSTFKI